MENLLLSNAPGAELVKEGLLPAKTINFGLAMDLGKPVRLFTESYLTEEQYRKFLAVMDTHRDPRPVIATDPPLDRV